MKWLQRGTFYLKTNIVNDYNNSVINFVTASATISSWYITLDSGKWRHEEAKYSNLSLKILDLSLVIVPLKMTRQLKNEVSLSSWSRWQEADIQKFRSSYSKAIFKTVVLKISGSSKVKPEFIVGQIYRL